MPSPENKKLKLLILTQKVDNADGLLGFFHDWLKEFANNFSQVTVICLFKGGYDLPGNVRVLSLGKEDKPSRWRYLWRFYKYLWLVRRDYDAVFVHINVVYIILAGLIWRWQGKPVGLWYAHKAVDLKLRLAEPLTDMIFTASPESFRLASAKVKVIGHGIDVDKFSLKDWAEAKQDKIKIISVGRISEIKNQLLLIRAVDILAHKSEIKNLAVSFIGSPPNIEGLGYAALLKEEVKKLQLEPYVSWLGNIPNKDLPRYYQQADLSVNLCPTGGLDKVVLESLACGVPAIVYNQTFSAILGDYKDLLLLTSADAQELAEKIKKIVGLDLPGKRTMASDLRRIVVSSYSIKNLVINIRKAYDR
ncbi:MAG: glycosyltransferase family 4 protein [Candidatus Buchananbacteria bacterium]